MEIAAVLALVVSAVVAGCATVAVSLSAGGGWGLDGRSRIAFTVLLCAMSCGALGAIALRGVLLAVLVMMWGHDSPWTTDLDRLRWLAEPFVELAAASAMAVMAAWLWGRPRWRRASFPIASALVVFAWQSWRGLGR